MYVKNVSSHYQSFRADRRSFRLSPGQVVGMTNAEYGDHTVAFLIARGKLETVSEDDGPGAMAAQAEEATAAAEEGRLKVNKAGEDTKKQVIMVQCAAQKKNGERCLSNVRVDVGEYDENTPYFCFRHTGESADDYERADGTWVKKAVAHELVEPSAEADDDVQPEPSDDNGQTCVVVENAEAESE